MDDPVTDGNPQTAIRHQGLEGNPAKTGEIFSDTAPYIRRAGNNRRERDAVEKACEKIVKKIYLHDVLNKYRGKEFDCAIGTETKRMQCRHLDLKHLTESLYGESKPFWIKSELLNYDILELCKDAEYIGQKISDTTHNSGDTLRLKRATDYFFYYKKVLPNNEIVFLHVGRYRDTGNIYLYDVTTYNPI